MSKGIAPNAFRLPRPPQPWIQHVAQSVAEHVEAKNNQADCESGPDRQPGRLEHIRAARPAEHPTPRWMWWRYSIAEKTDGRFRQNSRAQPHRCQNEDRHKDVR